MPWPQHYDGKGWNNAFGAQYWAKTVPTLFLLDKSGNNCCDGYARGQSWRKRSNAAARGAGARCCSCGRAGTVNLLKPSH